MKRLFSLCATLYIARLSVCVYVMNGGYISSRAVSSSALCAADAETIGISLLYCAGAYMHF